MMNNIITNIIAGIIAGLILRVLTQTYKKLLYEKFADKKLPDKKLRVLRILVTTTLGFIFGIINWRFASSGGPMPASIAWSIIGTPTLLGFVIGISAWKINYILHGIILGFIVSIPMAVSSLGFRGFKIFLGTLIMGMIYGFLIELITHFVVKEKKAEPMTSTS
jgi:hypothetical protein